jgi:HAD superfamily hydrolase (TIGR01509 family)
MEHYDTLGKQIIDSTCAFKSLLKQPFQLQAIFFDMDGVLFNSMPYHAASWHKAFEENGLVLPEYEPYMNEGSTALYTINKMFKKYKGIEVSPELTETIKQRKHQIMATMPLSEPIEYMKPLVKIVHEQQLDCWVVTGSAQANLYNRLGNVFHNAFERKKMITAHDVQQGKPHPEPYLKAMEKSGFGLHQAIVIENAPLGVVSAKGAGLFTIAINTGPLNPGVLADAGADLVLNNSKALLDNWPLIYQSLTL